jgi:hypothetical protein
MEEPCVKAMPCPAELPGFRDASNFIPNRLALTLLASHTSPQFQTPHGLCVSCSP